MSTTLKINLADDALIKEYISDSILRGIQFAPRIQFKFMREKFYNQQALITESEKNLIKVIRENQRFTDKDKLAKVEKALGGIKKF